MWFLRVEVAEQVLVYGLERSNGWLQERKARARQRRDRLRCRRAELRFLGRYLVGLLTAAQEWYS